MNKKDTTAKTKLEGIIINPYLQSSEDKEVELWQTKDELCEFGEVEITHLKAKGIEDIDFLCKRPQDCKSAQRYGTSCRCIREKFDSPRAFKLWCKTYSDEIQRHIKRIIR